MFFEELAKYDSEVYASCERELQRQRNNIELIANEQTLIDFANKTANEN